MVPLNSEEGTQDIFLALSIKDTFIWPRDSWKFLGLQGNQTSQLERKSVLNIHWKDWYSLEGLKLKLQYSGHLTWRANSLEKTVMLGKVEGRRKRGWQRTMESTEWTWVWASSGRWCRIGKPGMLWPMGLQRVGHHWVTEQQRQIKEPFTVA